MKRILSIDGGGIRGIMPAILLRELESRAGKSCAAIFDLLAGTSTGGIIVTGLLANLPASKLVDLYAQRGAAMFYRSFEQKIATGDGTLAPKYTATAMEAELQSLLGDTWLSETAGPELLVPSYDITKPEALVFRSWKARGTHLESGEQAANFDFQLRDLAHATAAPPYYFPPAQIQNKVGRQAVCIDGGMYANNPAALAMTAALRLWPGQEIQILSLGTGTLEVPLDINEAMKWGGAGWAPHLLDIMMDGAADAVTYQLDEIAASDFGPRHDRLQVTLVGPDPSMDNATPTNISALEELAAQWLVSASPVLDKYADIAPTLRGSYEG